MLGKIRKFTGKQFFGKVTGYRADKLLTFTLYEELIGNCQNVLFPGLLKLAKRNFE